MRNPFVIATAFFILVIAFCVRGTVMSKENTNQTMENAYYADWEHAFVESTRNTLAGQGYPDSGVTMTWVKKDGRRTYTVAVHHKRIGRLAKEEQEQLVQILLRERLGNSDCSININVN